MLNIDNYVPRSGRIIKEDGTVVNEADTINRDLNAVKVTNIDSGAFDATHDAMKTSNVWNGHKQISKVGFTVSMQDTNKIDWLDDVDLQGARTLAVFYTADKDHNISLKVDPNIPAQVGYDLVNGGEFGGLLSGSRCVVFTSLATANAQIIFYNASPTDVMNVSNIVLRFGY